MYFNCFTSFLNFKKYLKELTAFLLNIFILRTYISIDASETGTTSRLSGHGTESLYFPGKGTLPCYLLQSPWLCFWPKGSRKCCNLFHIRQKERNAAVAALLCFIYFV